jgi:hypothetical protein
MESDYYEYNTFRGILSLNRNSENPNNWDLRLNGELIHSRYIDLNQAAFDISRHDFGDEGLDELFQNIYVPSEIRFWRTTRSVYVKIKRL